MVWKEKDIEKAFNKICEHISEEGKSLNSALRLKGTPDKNTFYKWIDHNKHKEPSQETIDLCQKRFNQYARAVENRSDTLFEELILLAEKRDDCHYLDDNGNKRIDSAAVQAKRVEIDVKKWALSKMRPKKYGDKIDVTSGNKQIDKPFVVEIVQPKKED